MFIGGAGGGGGTGAEATGLNRKKHCTRFQRRGGDWTEQQEAGRRLINTRTSEVRREN
jgi:hypothetical protein